MKLPGAGFLIGVVFNFTVTCHSVFWSGHLAFLPAMYESSCCFTSLPARFGCLFCFFRYSDWYIIWSHSDLICISLTTDRVEHLFMGLLSMVYLLPIFAHLKKNCVFCFVEFWEFFVYFGYKSLLWYAFSKHFLWARDLSFYSLKSILCITKIFFIKSNLIFFFFHGPRSG